jgi:phenylalanyl-tRNA synthetase beta chain
MGGADTEIGLSTRDVLIEAAWFLPPSVRATSRRLGLKTDASFRFERGVDPEGVIAAQQMAVRLLADLAGGEPAQGIVDAYPGAVEPRTPTLRTAQLPRLLGYSPDPEEVRAALQALQLAPRDAERGCLQVTVPSWRVDLEREADLVEEVARHLGYERIPTGTSGLPTVLATSAERGLASRARDALVGVGFHEAFGYAMIPTDDDDAFVPAGTRAALPLTNPIAESLATLRRTMIPGLLRAVDLNLRRGVVDVRLFEVGHVFLARGRGEFPDESSRVGLAWCGAGRPRHWSEPEREVDLPDILGVVESVLETLRPALGLRRERSDLAGFHPGQSAAWHTGDGRTVAWAGRLHPDLQGDLPRTVFAAEIDLAALASTPRTEPTYAPLPRLTSVTRDLALVVGPDVDYRRIVATLAGVTAPAPCRFEAIDRYQGPPLERGQSSLTVRVHLFPREKTLTEEQIEDYRKSLIGTLNDRLGIAIRGE